MHVKICKYDKYPAALLREASNKQRGPSMHNIPLAEADRHYPPPYFKIKRLKLMISYFGKFL